VKRFIFLVLSLFCASSSPVMAQWGEPKLVQPTRDNNGNPIQYDSQGRPIERRLDNNGNPITPAQIPPHSRPATATEYQAPQSAITSLPPPENRSAGGAPPCYLEQPFIKQGNTLTGQYAGRCINERYNGKAVLNLIDQSNKWGDPLIFTVNYKDGKPFGTAMIDSGNGAMIFTGTLKNWQPWNGYTQTFDENNRPVRFGTRNGQDAPYVQIGQVPVFTAYIPPAELATASKPKRGGCDADRPTDRYFVTGEYPGECKAGHYTGTAELILTPKDASQPTIKIKAPFQDGYLSGPVVAKYPQYGITYKGTFDGWRPQDGISEQSTGDRNFLVKEYRSGVEVSSRSEYRPPSELEIALIGAAGQIGQNLGTKLGQEIDGTAGKQRQQKREAEAYQARQQDIARANDITRQAQATAGQQVRAEQVAQQQANDQAQADWQRQSDATIEGARRKALAGLDRDGNPLPQPAAPVQVARLDPQASNNGWQPGQSQWSSARVWGDQSAQPIPTVSTRPPVFGGPTRAPEFGGVTNPPIVTTRPPDLPAPQPADNSLPQPVQVASLPASITHGQGAVPPPLAPATQLPEPSNPPQPLASPVQHGSQSDTLGTGGSPSYPIPQNPPPSTPGQLTYELVMTPEELALNNRLPYDERATTLYSPSQIRQIKGDGRWANWVADARRLTAPVQVAQPRSSTANPTANTPSATQPVRSVGFDQSDQRWIASLPAELQVQVLRLSASQVDAYKARGDWTRFQTIVTQAAGEMRNASIEEQREKLAIWERAWSQSQKVLIEGGLFLLPVERIAVAVVDMAKVARGARIVGSVGVAASGLPEALTIGRNAETGVNIYIGVRSGTAVYCGITCNIAERWIQHGDRFDRLETITRVTLTRGEARSVEEALIVRNPAFENARHEIAVSQPYYQQALNWGEQWLRTHGF
jgi:hypothetical protein